MQGNNNRRGTVVQYQKFKVNPLLAEGLLPVAREGGDLERKVAAGMARVADEAGAYGDFLAKQEGARQGALAAINGAQRMTQDAPSSASTASPANRNAPDDIAAIVTAAARRHNVDPAALLNIARLESSYKPDAKNPRSTAGGLFQFIDSTAKGYGLKNRYDAAEASDAAARLARDNIAAFTRRLGRAPNAGELYLMHQQGAGRAIQLLGNPSARAVDIVGEDAVTLNGGTKDMTAQQFAGLWLRKAGSPTVLADPARSEGPISVTPVRHGPVWQPSGENTIFGRAYDVAGTKTYLAELDQTMRDDMRAVYEAYGDDPARLRTALGELQQAHLKEQVFEEIAPEFIQAFNRQASALVDKATADAERRAREADAAAFNARGEALATDVARAVESVDPATESAPAAIDTALKAYESHLDSAVARGLVSRDAADKAKRAQRANALSEFYVRQAQGKSEAEIAALHQTLRDDFKAGNLPGIDADAWRSMDRALTSATRKAKAGADSATATEKARVRALIDDDIASIASTGKPVDGLSDDAVAAALGEKGMADWRAKRAEAQAVFDATDGMEADTPQALAERVAALQPKPGEPGYADKKKIADNAAKTARAIVKAREADPLGFAAANGTASITPLDPTSPEIAATIAERRIAARTVSERFGTDLTFFTAGERQALKATLEQNPETMIAIVGAMSEGFGPDLPAALTEISRDAPMLAHVAGLTSATGDASIVNEVAAMLKLRQAPDYRKALPSTGRTQDAMRSISGAAFAALPSTSNAVRETALAIFEKRAGERGIDVDNIHDANDPAHALFAEAVNAALGARTIGTVRYGGLTDVNGTTTIAPPDMPAEDLQRRVATINDTALETLGAPANGITARDLRGATLVAIGNGVYRLALGDPASADPRYVQATDGGFWTLDIRRLAEIQGDDPVGAALRNAVRSLAQ